MNSVRFWDAVSALISLSGALLTGYQYIAHDGMTFAAAAGIAVFAAGIVIGTVKIRCPFCRHFLGLVVRGRFCPYCGSSIDD